MSNAALTKDLNILQATAVDIQYLNGDLNIIAKLDDEPNDVGGLSSDQLKAKFDEAGNAIKDYINNTLIPAILASDSTEAAREEAENQRAANENQRIQNETAREIAETARENAETQRQSNEQSRKDAETARGTAEGARITAENQRAANETQRQENEAARQTAEQARNVFEDYAADKAYVPGNKVAWQGSSYVCTAACTAIAPPDAAHWLLMAKKGTDGATMPASGLFGFDVDPDTGALRLYYTGSTPPDFTIDADGHLIYKLNPDVSVDIGKVQGPQGEQGIQGPAGHTPVKGTDYWTAADQASMVRDVLDALPTWTGGSY